jgi:hypothetical protein
LAPKNRLPQNLATPITTGLPGVRQIFHQAFLSANTSLAMLALNPMIDYQARKVPYNLTPEDRAWRRRRLGWYCFQLFLFFAIVYRIGPNLFLFHSPFSPGPRDFVAEADKYAPMIAAIKAYNRDFETWPGSSWELPPNYMPPNIVGEGGEIMGTSITFPVGHDVLEYEFSPAIEGWTVHSPRYDGPIPAAIVAAAAKPATQPSSGKHMSNPNGG